MRNWAIALGLLWLAYFLLSLMGIEAVLLGDLPGNDDAMRLLQVRELLSGASWYDVSRPRLITPEGGAMHWSRIPDIGIASLYLAARIFTGPVAAETFALIAWPLLLSFALASAGLFAMHRLGVSFWFSLIAMLLLTQTYTFSQFAFGRVDHHGLQVVLMLAAIGAVIGPSARSAFVAGLALSAMLSVAIEALPVVAVCLVASGLFWVLAPGERARHMKVFGGALILGSFLAFLLDAPGPDFNARAVCDAFGNAHLAALILGGVGFILLGQSKVLIKQPIIWRLVAVGCAGGVAALCAIVMSPECLANPYASLPDDVSTHWLASVGEAKPLFAQDANLIWQSAPILVFALLAGGWLVANSDGVQRRNWTFVLGLLIITSLATLWQTRGLTFSHMLAMLVAGGIYEQFFAKWRRVGGPGPLLVFAIIAAVLAPMTWVLIGAQFVPEASETVAGKTGVACHSRDTLRTVLDEPRQRILSTVDAGALILYYTDHQVFSAPYHRNPKGIELPIQVFSGPYAEAEGRVRAANAQRIFFCVGGKAEEHLYADWQPDGLAARLNSEQIPDWLKIEREGPAGATLYRVLEPE